MDKKAFIGLWADVFKGFIAGFIVGIIVMVLMLTGVIPFFFEVCGMCS